MTPEDRDGGRLAFGVDDEGSGFEKFLKAQASGLTVGVWMEVGTESELLVIPGLAEGKPDEGQEDCENRENGAESWNSGGGEGATKTDDDTGQGAADQTLVEAEDREEEKAGRENPDRGSHGICEIDTRGGLGRTGGAAEGAGAERKNCAQEEGRNEDDAGADEKF